MTQWCPYSKFPCPFSISCAAATRSRDIVSNGRHVTQLVVLDIPWRKSGKTAFKGSYTSPFTSSSGTCVLIKKCKLFKKVYLSSPSDWCQLLSLCNRLWKLPSPPTKKITEHSENASLTHLVYTTVHVSLGYDSSSITTKQQNSMNIQLILLVQYSFIYSAGKIGCFSEARTQPNMIQVLANYSANRGRESQMA